MQLVDVVFGRSQDYRSAQNVYFFWTPFVHGTLYDIIRAQYQQDR